MERKFYVYVISCEDGIVRYVGKGQNNRWLSHMKRPELTGLGRLCIEVTFHETETEALMSETALIAAYTSPHLLNKKGRAQSGLAMEVLRMETWETELHNEEEFQDRLNGHYSLFPVKITAQMSKEGIVFQEQLNSCNRRLIELSKARKFLEELPPKKRIEFKTQLDGRIYRTRRVRQDWIDVIEKLNSLTQKYHRDSFGRGEIILTLEHGPAYWSELFSVEILRRHLFVQSMLRRSAA